VSSFSDFLDRNYWLAVYVFAALVVAFIFIPIMEAVSNGVPDEVVPRPVAEATAGRFTVTRVQVVGDSLPYGDKRGVYVIVDTLTGAEYVGVSGVGITELGSHASSGGKTTTRDER
jgi:hypothetical protein